MLKANGVDTIAESGGFGAIVKDVTQVCVAAGANDFFTDHAVGGIDIFSDSVFVVHIIKTGPSCA